MKIDKTDRDLIESLSQLKQQPREELKEIIWKSLHHVDTQIIPLRHLKWIAAASILWIAMNVVAVASSNSKEQTNTTEYTQLSNYNLYGS